MIARGFSDLGYEQFIVLHGGKLVSCFTGQISDLKPEEQQHFFQILTCDEMAEKIIGLYWDIERLDYIDNREWSISLKKHGSDEKEAFAKKTLQEVFLAALSMCLKKEINND